MIRVFLGLGSNKGDRLQYLREAVSEFVNDSNIDISKCASVYETKPYGVKEQANYYNSVIEIFTKYSLEDLYDTVKQIEDKIGRKKSFRWGPREIDIDILLFGDVVLSDEKLTVPHKDLLNRDFVLKPLLEISNDIVHPLKKIKLDSTFIDKLENHILKIHEINLLNYLGAKVV